MHAHALCVAISLAHAPATDFEPIQCQIAAFIQYFFHDEI